LNTATDTMVYFTVVGNLESTMKTSMAVLYEETSYTSQSNSPTLV